MAPAHRPVQVGVVHDQRAVVAHLQQLGLARGPAGHGQAVWVLGGAVPVADQVIDFRVGLGVQWLAWSRVSARASRVPVPA